MFAWIVFSLGHPPLDVAIATVGATHQREWSKVDCGADATANRVAGWGHVDTEKDRGEEMWSMEGDETRRKMEEGRR
jgi:hypothetical protein